MHDAVTPAWVVSRGAHAPEPQPLEPTSDRLVATS